MTSLLEPPQLSERCIHELLAGDRPGTSPGRKNKEQGRVGSWGGPSMYHQLHCSHVQDGYIPGACVSSCTAQGSYFSPDISLPLFWGCPKPFPGTSASSCSG